MLHKDMRRAERRSRSFHVWMRRLKKDWADHGRQYSIYPVYDDYRKAPAERTIVGWRDTLCGCFDLRNMQALRFKDTPSGGHRKRVCNGSEGDKINAIKDERRLEVVREVHGSSQRRRKRMERRARPGVLKVKCSCGYVVGLVMVRPGEDRWSATSRKFGEKLPKCPNCEEKRKLRTPA
jgi:hypothetical protein